MGSPSDTSSSRRTPEAAATAARPGGTAVEDGGGAAPASGRPSEHHGSANSWLARLIRRMTGGDEDDFVLQIVQPSLVGLIDGTVSTLAPIFAAAVSTSSRTALLVGIATALGPACAWACRRRCLTPAR